MMLNRIDKFGVKQRCIDASKYLTDLFVTALHYERDVNFYVHDDDFRFLGVLNREILLLLNIPSDVCRTITVGEICKNVNRKLDFDTAYWQEGDNLGTILYNAFKEQFPVSEELAVVERTTERLIGIFNRRETFHELISVSAENESEIICYRELSHYYMPTMNKYNQFAKNVNSQHGEDGILSAIFDKIGTTSKYAVEFGGWDGIYLSNIRYLITDKGWSGLYIEGEEDRAQNLLQNYKDYPNVQCKVAFVGFRGDSTLDNILREKNVPEQIDLISIDIDGYDYHVWDALQQYRPRVIIIEYNPSIPNNIIFINPRNETVFCGSSAAALVELGRKKGYSLAAVTETNLIFVIDEEFDKLQIWDNDLNVLRAESRLGDGRFFQTYDKQVVLTGYTYYIWDGGKPISPDSNFVFKSM